MVYARGSAERLSHASAVEEAGEAKIGNFQNRDAHRVTSGNLGGRRRLQEQVLKTDQDVSRSEHSIHHGIATDYGSAPEA